MHRADTSPLIGCLCDPDCANKIIADGRTNDNLNLLRDRIQTNKERIVSMWRSVSAE